MNSRLIKIRAAVMMAGVPGAGTALAGEDLEVTMNVPGEGEQTGAAQDDASRQRERNREMQKASRQVREEAHEQAQEEISQMREKTASLREAFRDSRSNGR